VEYLVDNIFIRVRDKVYKQVVGIPVGTDCAPLLVNLFLFHYKYKFMKETLQNNPCKARKFIFTVRYIDDLIIPSLMTI